MNKRNTRKRTKKAIYLDDIQLIYLQEILDNIEHKDRLREILRQEVLIRIEGEKLFRERANLENKL